MYKRSIEQRDSYFQELARNLRRAGFEVSAEEDGLLPVSLEEQCFCQITSSGGVRYRREDVTDEHMSGALERLTSIIQITDEYMSLLDTAPFLRVGSQEDQYRLLADFNGTVLAGCQTKYGAQFVTWERGLDRTSLNDGHYYGADGGVDSYTAAKQDFAVRSGLIPRSALFDVEELAEIYRSVQEALESGAVFTVKQEDLLQEVREKIRDCVPDLDKRIHPAEAQKSEQEMEQSW